MYESIMEMAMSNAEKLGHCIGSMGVVLKWGNLDNGDYKTLATTYIQVVNENEFNKPDVDMVREEAARRGIDIG